MALPLPLIALAAKVLIPAAVSGIGRLFSRPSAPDYPTIQVGGMTWVAVPHGREGAFEAAGGGIPALTVVTRVAKNNPGNAQEIMQVFLDNQGRFPGHTLYIRPC